MNDSSSPTENLSPEQARTIAALITGQDNKSAAKTAGISESTLYRWLREDPVFKAALEASGKELRDQAVRRVDAAQSDALDTLISIMKNKKVAPGVRVRAAQVVLEMSARLRELSQWEDRIAALERMNYNARF